MEALNPEFSVYPNPASQQLNFSYNSNEEGAVHIILSNALGKTVYEADARSKNTLQISLHSIPAGVYVLAAYKGKEQVYQTKVICVK